MNRRRWYKAAWGPSLAMLKTAIMARAFQPGGFDGFLLERTRDDQLFGSYVERLTRTETITDPFGELSSFERVEYRRSEFVISDRAGFNLELVNPNRSASRLISRLLEVSNYDFVLGSAKVDPLDWVSQCARLMGREFTLTAMTAGAISIDKGVIGELALSGSGDILAAGKAALDGKSYSIEKVQGQFDGTKGSVIFNSTGAIAVKAATSAEIIDCARDGINLAQSM